MGNGKKATHTKIIDEDDIVDRNSTEEKVGELEDGTEAVASSRKRKRKRREKKKGDDADAGKKAKSEETYYDNAPVPGSEAFANDRTIYIEGVPFKATERDVREFFAPAGGAILSCRLPTWHDSGNLRGYGHIEFDSVAACEKAIELDGSYLKDRYIKVRGHGYLVFCSKRQEISRKFSDQRDVSLYLSRISLMIPRRRTWKPSKCAV